MNRPDDRMREFFAQLPDDSRRAFLAATPDNDGDGVPDLLQRLDQQGSIDASVTTTHDASGQVRTVITVDGITYDSPDQVPPRIVEQLRRAGVELPQSSGPAPRRAAPTEPPGSWPAPESWPAPDSRSGPESRSTPGEPQQRPANPARSAEPGRSIDPPLSVDPARPAHGQDTPPWFPSPPAPAQPASPSLGSISDQMELTRQMLGEAPPKKWWQFWKR